MPDIRLPLTRTLHVRLPFLCALLTALVALPSAAQDTRYVRDTLYVQVRSGAGDEHDVVHRGLASGTPVQAGERSADGEWMAVTLEDGTRGWMPERFLMEEPPASVQLAEAQQQVAQLESENKRLADEVAEMHALWGNLPREGADGEETLRAVMEELAQLRQISGKSLQLDADNRRLAEEAEKLRSQVDVLAAENLRLQDSLRTNTFMDGSLAVLLGVIITLVVPRLWPKRRRYDGWA
jgi:SH3 domain protein